MLIAHPNNLTQVSSVNPYNMNISGNMAALPQMQDPTFAQGLIYLSEMQS